MTVSIDPEIRVIDSTTPANVISLAIIGGTIGFGQGVRSQQLPAVRKTFVE